jgi:outer membrane protein insertion porin family
MIRTARAAVYVAMAIVGMGTMSLFYVVNDLAADPPAGKEIAEILVQGNRVRSTPDILSVFNLRPGEKYVEETIRSAYERLNNKGWFTPNGIQVSTAERIDGRVNLIIHVTELTNFIEEIQYHGNDHLSRKELDELSGLKLRMPMSPHVNAQARLNILRKYLETGRVHASVTLREGSQLSDRKVIFDIVEGPVVKIPESRPDASANNSRFRGPNSQA